MTYAMAATARVRWTDGTTRDFEGAEAESLYMGHTCSAARGKFMEALGGRNEFERRLQQKITDWLAGQEREGLPRLLIIGDSIRMRLNNATGYGVPAYRRLVGHFNLTHIPHNTGGTIALLWYLDNWLQCRPDIVHVNAGLHDLAFNPKGDPQPPLHNPPDVYGENLRTIIAKIRACGVKQVIWGRNTPVHDEWHQGERWITRVNAHVETYNEVADSVMGELDVPINDMYQPVMDAGLERCLLTDGVHLAHEGSALLGRVVADRLLELKADG